MISVLRARLIVVIGVVIGVAIGLVMGLPNGMSPKAWAHSPTIHSAAPPTATAADATADLSFEVCIADRDGRCFTYSEGQIREVLRGQTFVQRALDDKAARKLVSRIESDLKNFPQSKAPCASTIRFVKSGQELKQVCRELLPRPQVQTWKALLKELEASTLK